MGPPIHYYGDMNMAEDQDKNNEDELTKMLDEILDEVFKDFKFDEDSDEEE